MVTRWFTMPNAFVLSLPDSSLCWRWPAAEALSRNPAQLDREVFESTFFLSPDGNIACNIGMDEGVRCDIIDADWPRPARPADCQESYGHMIAITPWIGLGKPAEFICAGDTVFGSDEPLQDGESITSGAFRCESVDSGITCRNTETAHGFSISFDAYQSVLRYRPRWRRYRLAA